MLRRAVLFGSVMLGLFVLFEAGLRLKGGSEAAPAFQRLFMQDPRIGFRLKPGEATVYRTPEFETEIRINGAGVRGEEFGPKGANERRIVVLGDSLVLAVQVPLAETFCKRLEVHLNADPARGPFHYRVINAGVQGYGPVQEALFYEHVAASFDADVVLVGLYVANDAIEAADQAYRLAGGPSVPGSAGTARPRADRAAVSETTIQWARRWARRSMVLQILRLRAVTLAERVGKARGIERALTSYLPETTEEVSRGLLVTREAVSRIVAVADARGARVGVLLLPARFQLDDTDFGHLREAAAAAGQTLVRDGASARFREAMADLPAPALDLLVPFRADADPVSLYFEKTAHFTPRGHEVVARAVKRFLDESRLLDRMPPPATAATTGEGR